MRYFQYRIRRGSDRQASNKPQVNWETLQQIFKVKEISILKGEEVSLIAE